MTHQLSPTQIALLLARHDLPPPTRTERLGAHTWRVNDEVVVRLDPDVVRAAGISVIYRRLSLAGVAVPTVLALDTLDDQAALLVRHVPGVSAADIWPTLAVEQQEALSEQCGMLLGRIHAVRWPGYGAYNDERHQLGSIGRWKEAFVQRLTGSAAAVERARALPLRLVDGVITALNDADSLFESAAPPTLTHGRLDWSNVLIEQTDAGWRITALLGWRHALVADAAWEFAQLWLRRAHLYPEADSFMSGYKAIQPQQPDQRSRVQLYRLLVFMEGALEARHAGDEPRRQRWEAALERALGRR